MVRVCQSSAAKRFAAVAVAVLCFVGVSSSVWAAPIVTDGFDDGGRSDGVDLSDVNWVHYNGGATTVNTAGSLTGNNPFFDAGGTFRGIAAGFPSVTLGAPGSFSTTVRLTMDFQVFGATTAGAGATLTGVGVPSGNATIRLGLYSTAGTLPVSDAASNTANDFGYRIDVPVGPDTSTTAGVDLVQELGINGNIFGGSDNNGVLTAESSTGTFRIADNNPRSIRLTITNLGSSVEITGEVFAGAGLTGGLLGSVTATDVGAVRGPLGGNAEAGTNQRYTTFDLVGLANSAVDFNFRFDNVVVDVVPEPAPVVLMGLVAVIGFAAAVRRRRPTVVA